MRLPVFDSHSSRDLIIIWIITATSDLFSCCSADQSQLRYGKVVSGELLPLKNLIGGPVGHTVHGHKTNNCHQRGSSDFPLA